MKRKLKILFSTLVIALLAVNTPAIADETQPKPFTVDELINQGHGFFDATTSGLAYIIEENAKQFGLPNAYILGEEGSGAFIGGIRYGEGNLYTKDNQEAKIYWQGPTIGWDFGADGNRTMILIYNLNSTNDIFGRYPGVSGSAFFVGGLGMTVMKYRDIVIVPVRSGVGARLGANVGYLKFRDKPTWNPF